MTSTLFNALEFGHGDNQPFRPTPVFRDHDFVSLMAESAKSGLQEWIARLECELSALGVAFEAFSIEGQKAQKRAFPTQAPDGTKYYRLLLGHELLGKGSIVTYVGASDSEGHAKVRCIHVGEIDLPLKIMALTTQTELYKPPMAKGE